MRRGGVRAQVLHVTTAIAALSLALVVAFYLSSWVLHTAGIHVPPLLALIVNAMLAILLPVLAVNIAGLFFRRRRNDFFDPITVVLGRIASGDFTTRLEEGPAQGPFADLVRTVNQTAAKLDQLEKMRQEFVSNVSHEIQSPLTSIRGFASALRADGLSSGGRTHYLEIIEAGSQRLARLSANLLKMASLGSDQTQLSPKQYRLDRQIGGLILACEAQWTE